MENKNTFKVDLDMVSRALTNEFNILNETTNVDDRDKCVNRINVLSLAIEKLFISEQRSIAANTPQPSYPVFTQPQKIIGSES